MLFYITVEQVDVVELEPSRKKPQVDIERDSAMGLSVFTGGNSTTLSDVSLLNYTYLHSTVATMLFFLVHQDPLDRELEELDYELRVQGITDTSSFHETGIALGLLPVSVFGYLMVQMTDVGFLAWKNQYNLTPHLYGFNSIHMAAISGNLEKFKYLITENNCNPAYPGPRGLTCLHLASQQGHLGIVKYLVIEQQIDPLCEDDYGNTPLHRSHHCLQSAVLL